VGIAPQVERDQSEPTSTWVCQRHDRAHMDDAPRNALRVGTRDTQKEKIMRHTAMQEMPSMEPPMVTTRLPFTARTRRGGLWCKRLRSHLLVTTALVTALLGAPTAFAGDRQVHPGIACQQAGYEDAGQKTWRDAGGYLTNESGTSQPFVCPAVNDNITTGVSYASAYVYGFPIGMEQFRSLSNRVAHWPQRP
jgi:hypothetical protein